TGVHVRVRVVLTTAHETHHQRCHEECTRHGRSRSTRRTIAYMCGGPEFTRNSMAWSGADLDRRRSFEALSAALDPGRDQRGRSAQYMSFASAVFAALAIVKYRTHSSAE